MTKKKTPTVLHTIISDIEPLTEDEIKVFNEKWRREWFENNIGGIIALAASELDLQKLLVEAIGDNNALRKNLMDVLPSLVKVGGKKKWTKGRYVIFLSEYACLYLQANEEGLSGRSDYAFRCLSDRYGISIKYAKDCLRKARGKLTERDVSDWVVPFLNPQKKSHQ